MTWKGRKEKGKGVFFYCSMGGVVSSILEGVVGLLGQKPRRPVDLRTVIKKQVDEPSVAVKEKKDPSIVPESKPKTVDELIAEARRRFGLDVTNDYNFAIVGQSGSGKSSLVNALRGVDDDQEGAAAVGETETTTEVKRYTHPKLPYVALWDIPGAGTLKQPSHTYFEKHMLYAFDCILILSADRFLEVDLGIAQKARDYKRPCAFVRTKADQSVRSIARRTKMTMADASRQLRDMVNNSFRDSLKLCGLSHDGFAHKLYIVSAWAFADESTYSNRNDKSLANMDELELLNFVANSVRYRV